MSESKNKPRLRLRLFALFLGRLAVLIGPLVCVLVANRAEYFTTVGETTKIALGAMICVVFVALLLLGVLKPPGTLYMFGFVFLLSGLLEPLLQDLFLLSGVAFGSKFIDWAVLEPLCRTSRAKLSAQKNAESTASEVEKVIEKYLGRV